MSVQPEYEQVEFVMNKYYEAQKFGNSEILRPYCHENAIMHGDAGDLLLEGSFENLYNFIDSTGGQPNIKMRMDITTLIGTVANVQCLQDSDDGRKYVNLFQLYKVRGEWKIVSKIFHQYAQTPVQ